MPEFVELRIHVVNKRVSGEICLITTSQSMKYHLKEPNTLCTVNSTKAQLGVYDNNYILAQTASESASVYPIIMVTLVGEEKPVPTEITSAYNMHVPVAVILVFSAVLILIVLRAFLYFCLVVL